MKKDTMLKTCLECLAGSRVESELYCTVLNMQTTEGETCPEQHLQNQKIFRLPRSLNLNDEIEITGTIKPNPEKLFLNLITGTSSPDYKNIACQLEVNFLSQNILLRCIENGNKYNEEDTKQSPSDLFPDSEFKFIIKVMEEQELEITIGISQNDVELKQNIKNITCLTLTRDINKVEELKFKFA